MNFPIKVGVSPTLGIRGIIAARDIKKGEIVERCPLILFPASQDKDIEKTVLGKYHYEWTSKVSCIALGYGSLYNHSNTPNLACKYSYGKKEMFFKALRNITKDEELTQNYMDGSSAKLDPIYTDYNKDIKT